MQQAVSTLLGHTARSRHVLPSWKACCSRPHGGLLMCRLCVCTGRRWSLLLALLVNALFGLLSAVARTSGELMALRLLAGVGVGGSVPVVFALLAELLPSEARWGADWHAICAWCVNLYDVCSLQQPGTRLMGLGSHICSAACWTQPAALQQG